MFIESFILFSTVLPTGYFRCVLKDSEVPRDIIIFIGAFLFSPLKFRSASVSRFLQTGASVPSDLTVKDLPESMCRSVIFKGNLARLEIYQSRATDRLC